MKSTFMYFFLICATNFHFALSVGSEASDVCKSPQFLEINQTGTVNCSFEIDFLSAYWYNSSTTESEHSIIDLSKSVKSGPGWISGEYDVHSDGSLIINNVQRKHEGPFSVAVFFSEHQFPAVHTISVKTIVLPSPPFPIIEGCVNEHDLCVIKRKSRQQLTCFVNESRPTFPVTWFEVRGGDKTNKSSAHGPSSSISTSLFVDSSIYVLTCEADNRDSLLIRDRSIAIITNEERSNITSVETVYVKLGDSISMSCKMSNITAFLWEKIPLNHSYQSLAAGVWIERHYIKTFISEFNVTSNGTAYIKKTLIHHNGMYRCTSCNATSDDMIEYNLQTYVLPNIVYPVVTGCNNVQDCHLQVDAEGTLTCSMKGVYPNVSLSWDLRNVKENAVTFLKQWVIFSEKKPLVEVTLTSYYRINPWVTNKLLIACRVVGKHADIFPEVTTVNLLVLQKDDTPSVTPTIWALIIYSVVAFLLLMAVVVYLICKSKGCYRDRKRTSGSAGDKERQTEIPLIKYDEGTKLLRDALQETYKSYYCAIRPSPIKSNVFKVNDLFVDGGISYAEKCDLTTDNIANMIKESKLILIESEACFGKTMLTLQLAHKWCEECSLSSMADVDVLILIKLTEVVNAKSIYDAITSTLLKDNLSISTKELKRILNSSRVLFIFDDFDEYTKLKGENSMNFVSDICKGKSFPDSSVILTTRPLVLPIYYHLNATKLKLAGFDKKMQTTYKSNVCQNTSAEKSNSLDRIFHAPSAVTDIFRIPLVFTRLVHFLIDQGLEQANELRLADLFHFIMKTITAHHNIQFKRETGNENFQNLCKSSYDSLTSQTSSFLCINDKYLSACISSGILQKNEDDTLPKAPNKSSSSDEVEVRFCYPVIREWYAAQYLVNDVESKEIETELQHFDMSELHYILLFACGMNMEAGRAIIRYSKSSNSFKEYILLCQIEQYSRQVWSDLLREYCSKEIRITDEDSEHLQTSKIYLLVIASSQEISVPNLVLDECWNVESTSKTEIMLSANVSMPVLPTLRELTIDHDGSEIFKSSLSDVITYLSDFTSLKTLRFDNCLLPYIFQLPLEVKFEVHWFPSVKLYILNASSGKWQHIDGQIELDEDDYHKEVIRLGITQSTDSGDATNQEETKQHEKDS